MSILTFILVIIVVGGVVLIGLRRLQTLRAADLDLGPVSFDRLHRRWRLNDALAAAPETYSKKIDIAVPVFPLPVDDLRLAFARVLAREARITLIASDETIPSERYVQRTEALGFPDTIDVRYYLLANGHSTLALYSRSKFGLVDFGVNRSRLLRWLGTLISEIRTISPQS